MRTLVGITTVALCLTLLGCKMPGGGGKASALPASANPGSPFLGLPPGGAGATPAPGAPDPGSLTSGGTRREGVLAGRILDQDSRLRPGAIIQVIDLDSTRDGGAPLSVMGNADGFFDIAGLEAGRRYRLVARVKDGSRTLVGTARVVAPNVRVAIFLEDELPGDSASPDAGRGSPPASLGAPIRNPGEGTTTPVPGSSTAPAVGVTPPVVNTSDPSLMADKGKKGAAEGGFTREVPSPTVTVPPPAPGREHTPEKPADAPYVPPAPPLSVGGNEPTAAVVPAPPSGAAEAELPVTRTVVPSCVKVGNRVENFALYDARGNVFELAKQRKGKLVLIDFWFTGCGPCIRSIPHLNKLQGKYGKHGLEVIGVTYEQGTLEQKQQSLARARLRHNLTFGYRLLFGGGGAGPCPVRENLEVHAFPTLVLLDETGRILWRNEGLDDQSAYQLEWTIYRKLFPNRVAGR